MTTSKIITADSAFALTAAQRRQFTMRSADPYLLARPTHDFILDARFAAGHASGVLPADGAALGAGGLVNLARDNHAATPAAVHGAATGIPRSGSTITYSGDGGTPDRFGIVANAAAGACATAAKVGHNNYDVGRPAFEGYLDFLAIAWVNIAAVAAMGVFGYSQPGGSRFWGVNINAGMALREVLTGRTFTWSIGVWQQLAVHYRFDTGAGKIFARMFHNGAEQNAGLAATAAVTTISTMDGWAYANAGARFAGNGIDLGLNGKTARYERLFTAIAGYELDPAEEVTRNWSVLRAGFGL